VVVTIGEPSRVAGGALEKADYIVTIEGSLPKGVGAIESPMSFKVAARIRRYRARFCEYVSTPWSACSRQFEFLVYLMRYL
jgi:hypothetical protein